MGEAVARAWMNGFSEGVPRGDAIKRRKQSAAWGSFDNAMLVLSLVAVAFGLLAIYSASYPTAIAQNRVGYFYVVRQACYALFGGAIMIAVMFCSPRALRRLSFWFLVVCAGALILTLFLAHGEVKRWVRIGPITLQASEWAKVALILYGAEFLSRRRRSRDESFVKAALPLLSVIMLFTILVWAQAHLSGALLVLMSGVLVCWFGNMRLRHLIYCAAIVLSVILLAAPLLVRRYQWERLIDHINSRKDMLGKDYQRFHARSAFLRGGVFGCGFCKGVEKQLYLPAVLTDFIFSSIAEEGGLIATLAIVVFYGWLVWYGFKVAMSCSSRFGMALCSSIVTLIAMQAALHIAINMGILPTTGIPLPLISYGGNSLVTTLLGLGLLFNMSLHKDVPDMPLEAVSQNAGHSNSGHGSGRNRWTYISSCSSRRGNRATARVRKGSVRWRIAGS